MQRCYAFFASLLGFSGVALGAFAAHALKGRVLPEQWAVLQTGVSYQMWHALALLAVALLLRQHFQRTLVAAGALFLVGTLLFSGSLYVLTLTEWRLGIVTPIGGVCLLLGWLFLAVSAVKLGK